MKSTKNSMRDIKEILKIGMKYHYCWGGGNTFMCLALCDALEDGAIAREEFHFVQDFIEKEVLIYESRTTLVQVLGFSGEEWLRESTPFVKEYWENLVK